MAGKDAWSNTECIIEMGEGFLHHREATGCDLDIADEFVDIFGDELKLDGYVGEAFAVGGP